MTVSADGRLSGAEGPTGLVEQASLGRLAATGAVWTSLEMAGTQAISLVVFAVLAHFVQPSEFGLMSVAYVAVFSLKAVSMDSIAFAIIRKSSPTNVEYNTAFWITAICGVAMAAVLFAISPVIAGILGTQGLLPVMRSMSIMLIFFSLARTHELRLARSFQFRVLAIRAVGGAIVGGVVGVCLAIMGFGVDALVWQQVVGSVVSLLLLLTGSQWVPRLQISRSAVVEIVTFMRSMLPLTTVSVVNQNTDTLLVAYFFGPAATGLYSVGKRLRLALITAVATPINSVGLPILAEVQDDPTRLRNSAHSILTAIMITCLPVFVGACVLSSEIVTLCFGQRWETAGPTFAILALGGPCLALQSFFDAVFTAKRKQIWSFYVLLSYTVLSIVCFVVLSSLRYGNFSLPFVLPYVVITPLGMILASRLLGLTIFDWFKVTAAPFAGVVLMYAGVVMCRDYVSGYHVLGLVVLIVVGAALFVATMFVTNRSELMRMYRQLRKKT